MLTYEDCIGLCDLTEDEVAAIAEHEHLPDVVALEIGNYIVHGHGGAPRIKRIILEDIEVAERSGRADHALALKMVLRHFVETHPDAE